MRLHGVLLLTTGLLLAADSPKGAGDHDKIQGTWKIVAEIEDGKEGGPARNEKVRVRFTADKMIFSEGDEKQEAVYKLDPSRTPRTMELTPDGGPNKGKKVLGIYELSGDKLTICVAIRAGKDGPQLGKDAPSDFTAKADSGCTLLKLERVKP